jgi:hypothetical protein
VYPVRPETSYWFTDQAQADRCKVKPHAKVRRRQFPLTAGLAATIHWSQGKTGRFSTLFEKYTTAISVYVALTRCRCAEDMLMLAPFSKDVFQQGPIAPYNDALLHHLGSPGHDGVATEEAADLVRHARVVRAEQARHQEQVRKERASVIRKERAQTQRQTKVATEAAADVRLTMKGRASRQSSLAKQALSLDSLPVATIHPIRRSTDDAATQRAAKTSRQRIQRHFEQGLVHQLDPWWVGIPNDGTNSCFAASVIQAIRMLMPLRDILDSPTCRSAFKYAGLIHSVVEWSEMTSPAYRRTHKPTAHKKTNLGNALRASRDGLLQHLAADEQQRLAEREQPKRVDKTYEFGDRYGAIDFFERVLAERAADTTICNPFRARCEVVDLLCGTMDTSAQALIDTEEQASTGMRAPMSVLVLNISRSTPDGILNTEVRANRDVTRHCSRYKLRAIVEYTHKKGGHFVTHVRHLCAGSPDRWHTCDDETVTQCGTDPPVTAT